LLFSCYYTASPFPSNTTLMKRIMIRNSKKNRRPASRKHLCTLTRRQLRAAMTIPVMYEQLKREKLRLHKARYVLASWGEIVNKTKQKPNWMLFRKSGFESHSPCGSTELSLTPVSGNPTPSSGLCRCFEHRLCHGLCLACCGLCKSPVVWRKRKGSIPAVEVGCGRMG
jgi:hypothetical protein